MQIELPTVAVWNGPALMRITLMCVQCGRMQLALFRIIMRIVGLVWTGLKTLLANVPFLLRLQVLQKKTTTTFKYQGVRKPGVDSTEEHLA